MMYELDTSYIVSFASGKGGVGKSIATINMAESLISEGYRVAVIDADLGLSNCAALLNEQIPATVLDLHNEQCYLEDVIHMTDTGLTLVTGADEPDARISDWSILYPELDQVIRALQRDHDFILIDTPAGVSHLSLWALDRSDRCVLMLVDEPTVISDVYRFCKYIMQIDPAYPFSTIVNFVEEEKQAVDVVTRFNQILIHFLDRRIPYLGYLPSDPAIRQSVSEQRSLANHFPESEAAKEFRFLADTLVSYARDLPGSDGSSKSNPTTVTHPS